MNKIVNKFLLAGYKLMPELHLIQAIFTYSSCGPFTKHCKRIQLFKETGSLKYIYKNELDKACFAHNFEYVNSNELAKRMVSDKILKDIAYKIARNPKYDGCQRELTSMVFEFFDKKQDQERV